MSTASIGALAGKWCTWTYSVRSPLVGISSSTLDVLRIAKSACAMNPHPSAIGLCMAVISLFLHALRALHCQSPPRYHLMSQAGWNICNLIYSTPPISSMLYGHAKQRYQISRQLFTAIAKDWKATSRPAPAVRCTGRTSRRNPG